MKTPASPLRTIRRTRTLSQHDLARLVGVSQQTIAKYELDRLTPPEHIKALMAAILGSTPETLFPEAQP